MQRRDQLYEDVDSAAERKKVGGQEGRRVRRWLPRSAAVGAPSLADRMDGWMDGWMVQHQHDGAGNELCLIVNSGE